MKLLLFNFWWSDRSSEFCAFEFLSYPKKELELLLLSFGQIDTLHEFVSLQTISANYFWF